MKRISLIVIALLILAIIIPFIVARSGEKPLDDAARKKAPGKFIELTHGLVHYELAGPETGTPVVLVHGFSVPMFLWDKNFNVLADAGFRVLRYDLYGRGYSDKPAVKNDDTFFIEQLRELREKTGMKKPVNLVGLSMGGAIVTGFTARYPELADRLCLISPAGYSFDESFAYKLVKIPVFGEYLFTLIGKKVLISNIDKNFNKVEQFPEFKKQYIDQIQYRGFLRSIRSTMRYFPMGSMRENYQKLRDRQDQVLLIWGRDDQVLPFEVSADIRKELPGITFFPVDKSGHNSQYETPEIINREIIRFLR